RRASRARGQARVGPALPAFDRPAAQGRSPDRRLPAGRRGLRRGAPDPREAVRLRPADPCAGRRRLRVLARARPSHRTGQDGGGGVMQLGMIGLGRMGSNMTARVGRDGHDVKTYDPAVPSTAESLEKLRDQLDAPRAFWMMVPAGKITEDTFQSLLGIAGPGDTIVDGGNSNFRDSRRRHLEADP